MSLEQYNQLMSDMLNQQQNWKEERGESISVVESLGTWPITAGTVLKKRRGN